MVRDIVFASLVLLNQTLLYMAWAGDDGDVTSIEHEAMALYVPPSACSDVYCENPRGCHVNLGEKVFPNFRDDLAVLHFTMTIIAFHTFGTRHNYVET